MRFGLLLASILTTPIVLLGACRSPAETSEPSSPTTPTRIVADDHSAAVDAALANDRLLLVNFSGITCVNCRAIEQRVLPELARSGELDGFVESRLRVERLDAATTEPWRMDRTLMNRPG